MTSGPIHFGDTKGLICAAAKSARTAVSRFGLSYRDALTVAAAQQQGCSYLLTEDLQHDQIMDGVRILNPFLVGPDRLDAKP